MPSTRADSSTRERTWNAFREVDDDRAASATAFLMMRTSEGLKKATFFAPMEPMAAVPPLEVVRTPFTRAGPPVVLSVSSGDPPETERSSLMRRILPLLVAAGIVAALAVPAVSTTAAQASPISVQLVSKHKNKYSHWGSFTSVEQNGSGDAVVTLPKKAKYGIVTATYGGADNFAIQGLDNANQPTLDLLVNTIGAYDGTTAFGLLSAGMGNPTTTLKITASGPWTLKIAPIKKAPKLTASGSHDGVFRYSGKATKWDVANQGEANFIVTQYTKGPMPNQAVNEIGTYSGTVPAMAGPSVVVVQSDGAWSVN
jgi:hypothetical protein